MEYLAILLLVLVIGFGVMLILRPDLKWEITERWRSRNADGPSDLYVFNTRLTGWMLILASLVGLGFTIPLLFEDEAGGADDPGVWCVGDMELSEDGTTCLQVHPY